MATGSPRRVGVDLSNWSWKAVRAYVEAHAGVRLSRASCLRYLHRLDFVRKRPHKRLVRANAARRADFVSVYRELVADAERTGATIFFVDEAHFRADGDLRGMWVHRGTEALVDSTSPRWGEKANYYSAVCIETGVVEVMDLVGNSTAATSATFLQQLRTNHPEPLIIIWDNGPAHGGDALRSYLTTPNVRMRLLRLPAYSPDFNSDEAIWNWARADVTGNVCLGTTAKVQEHLAPFFAGLANRLDEVKRRCQTVLQTQALATATM